MRRAMALLLFITTALLGATPAAWAVGDADFPLVESAPPAPAGPDAQDENSLAHMTARMLLALSVVLALMGVAVWIMRRAAPRVAVAARPGGIDVLSTRALGQRRSLMLVRARGKVLLLGVTPHRIDCLSEIEEEETGWNAAAAAAGLEEPPVPETRVRSTTSLEERP